ncbi:MAG: TldD/PmbA family protein, partial [Euryarchaeota archaeon]|nr:TldD/PmbA family protein [Euryarchaeota archaeon]
MEDILLGAIDRMQKEGAEFCDARYQTLGNVAIRVVDKSVRALTQERMGGVCFRARIGGSWGYSTTVLLDRPSLIEACLLATKNTRLGGSRGAKLPELPSVDRRLRADVDIHPVDVPIEEKLRYVEDLDAALKVEDRVVNTNAIYGEEVRTNLLMNSFGSSVKWEEVRIRLIAHAIASEAGRQEAYYEFVDGTKGFELVKGTDIGAMGRTCGEEAVRMLSAKKPPSGYMTCISDPQITGFLAHEVMGHACEADEIVKRRSFLTDAVGKQVASELITMIDDGTVKDAYGSIPFDDEGTPSSRTVIIENGTYKGYLHSLETAAE